MHGATCTSWLTLLCMSLVSAVKIPLDKSTLANLTQLQMFPSTLNSTISLMQDLPGLHCDATKYGNVTLSSCLTAIISIPNDHTRFTLGSHLNRRRAQRLTPWRTLSSDYTIARQISMIERTLLIETCSRWIMRNRP